jgi:sec-independent protein translocase protein TatC
MSAVVQDVRRGDDLRQLKAWMWQSMMTTAVLLADMSFLDHLEELRKRIIKCLIAVGAGLMICLTYTQQIILFLNKPAEAAGIRLVAIDSTEIFSIYFKVALAGGICLASPVILWQAWRFIEPALYKHEKRWAAPFLISTILCFILGACFGYFVGAPWLLKLETVWGKAVHIEITMSSLSYIGLLTGTIVAMGAVFEMPPIVAILSRIGLINARFLVRHLNYAIVIFTILAAVITPTGDIPPTVALTCVMLAIYAVSIVMAWLFGKPRRAEAE